MKKFLLIFISAVTILSAVAIGYFGIIHKSLSSIMNEAKIAEARGNPAEAARLYRVACRKDPANETAYERLAVISEAGCKYADAAYFWEHAANLNPLKPEYVEKMFEALSASGADDYCIFKYSAFGTQKKLSDRIRFIAATAYLRKAQKEKSREILTRLSAGKSPFAPVLNGFLLLSEEKTQDALSAFASVRGNPAKNLAAATAKFGTALCRFTAGDVKSAKTICETLKSPTPSLRCAILLLKRDISVREKEPKAALEYSLEARKIRTQDLELTLQCAELAFSQKKAAAIAGIRKSRNPKSKSGAILDYYLAALENAAAGNMKASAESLAYADTLRNRLCARLLSFRLACRLSSVEKAADEAARLSARPDLPAGITSAIRADCLALLRKCETESDSRGAHKISEVLVKCDPGNVAAWRYVVASRLSEKNYTGALSSAHRLIELAPGDRLAAEATLTALDALGNSGECLKYAKAQIQKYGPTPFSAFYAARSAAALKLNDEAVGFYTEAAKSPGIPEAFLIEAAGFVADHASGKDFESFFTRRSPGENPVLDTIYLTFKARFLANARNIEAAREHFELAIKASPKSEAAYGAAAEFELGQQRPQAAVEILERGVANLPESYGLSLRLALLLAEDQTPAGARKAKDKLLALHPQPTEAAYVFAALSNCFATLGDAEAAFSYSTKALNAAPNEPEALLAAGERLYARNNAAEAFRMLARIDNIAENPKAAGALRKIFSAAVSKEKSPASRKHLAEIMLKKLPGTAEAERVFNEAKIALSKRNEPGNP